MDVPSSDVFFLLVAIMESEMHHCCSCTSTVAAFRVGESLWVMAGVFGRQSLGAREGEVNIGSLGGSGDESMLAAVGSSCTAAKGGNGLGS